MNFVHTIKTIPDLCLQPRKNFESVRKNPAFLEALGLFFATAMAVTVALLITGLINQEQIMEANLALKKTIPGSSSPMMTMMQEMAPWNHLLFPIFGIVYVMTAGLIRHSFISLMGEKERSLMKTQSIHLRSAVPAMILVGLGGVISNLFPVVVTPGHMFNAASIISLVLTMLAIIWEAVVIYKAFRVMYDQNRGRAILTYFSLPVMGGIMFIMLVMLMSFALVLGK